jgi:hypothetical protein
MPHLYTSSVKLFDRDCFVVRLRRTPRNDIQNRLVPPFEYCDLDIGAYLLFGAWCLGFGEGKEAVGFISCPPLLIN